MKRVSRISIKQLIAQNMLFSLGLTVMLRNTNGRIDMVFTHDTSHTPLAHTVRSLHVDVHSQSLHSEDVVVCFFQFDDIGENCCVLQLMFCG